MARTTHDNAGIAANTDVKAKATIGSYAEAKAFLHSQGGNYKAELASNVRVERDIGDYSGPIHVVLYDTRIVTYFPDETFTPDDYQFWHNNKILTTSVNGNPAHVEGVRLPVNKEGK
jgi:hypothetical protein